LPVASSPFILIEIRFQQRNFKQKIVALLKRFRPEELEGDPRRGQGVLRGERDLDALFQELESLSCGEESGQDIDSISIGSTPKPSLRPFFNSKQDNVLGEFVLLCVPKKQTKKKLC
jgi:phosphofurin acidic cluster sorting protein 2